MRTPFRPLLKWPGGKTREWPRIAPHLPADIRHFVDPFTGGGAPFGLTPHSGDAYMNDRHQRLIALYRGVQAADQDLASELHTLADDWNALAPVALSIQSGFREAVAAHRAQTATDAGALHAALADGLGSRVFGRTIAGERTVLESLLHAVRDKARRVARLEQRHDVLFDSAQLNAHAETAVRAGYYTLVRAHEHDGTGPAAVADFVFVREYCYGSMFRTSRAGRFNIPYGGTSYNGKSFATRAAQLTAVTTVDSLAGVAFHEGDFQPFLASVTAGMDERDFVFVDPPYHSDFSTYGANAFDLDDHCRLAAVLAALPTRWMQVIKATPEVRALYSAADMERRGVRIADEFGKRYGYNVRGRNDRAAQHLVITNY